MGAELSGEYRLCTDSDGKAVSFSLFIASFSPSIAFALYNYIHRISKKTNELLSSDIFEVTRIRFPSAVSVEKYASIDKGLAEIFASQIMFDGVASIISFFVSGIVIFCREKTISVMGKHNFYGWCFLLFVHIFSGNCCISMGLMPKASQGGCTRAQIYASFLLAYITGFPPVFMRPFSSGLSA